MEVHFSQETESRLAKSAATSGRAAEEYVRELVERHLDENTAFREAVRKGFSALDRGDFLEEDEMKLRVARLLRA